MKQRRYEPLLKIASGGTAAVHVGAASGALGFRQLVAIKIPHAHLADDPSFVKTLVEEAKIASRIRHANVVDVRDVEADDKGVQLVMDYVEGASLSDLIRGWEKDEPAVAIRIVLDVCEGLRALHELASEDGKPLGLVHRDVSPANILVGLDGVARIADFGLAKPLLSVERTSSEGALRGKLGYMAPEYVRAQAIDQRIDVFAMGVVLWEAISRKRLFRGENDADTLERIQKIDPPKLASAPWSAAIDDVIAKACAKQPDARYATIADFAEALEGTAHAFDLAASHAGVRNAFPAALRSTLEERRRSVESALAAADPSEVKKAWTDETSPAERSPFASPLAGSISQPAPASPMAGSVVQTAPIGLADTVLEDVPALSVKDRRPQSFADTMLDPMPGSNPPPASPLANSVLEEIPRARTPLPEPPPRSRAPLTETVMAESPLKSLPPSRPPSQPPASGSTRASAAPSTRSSSPAPPSASASSRASTFLVLGVAVLLGGALFFFFATREDGAPPPVTAPNAVASEPRPRTDPTRDRAPIDSSAPPPPATHAHPPPPPATTDKTPRPNPYGKP